MDDKYDFLVALGVPEGILEQIRDKSIGAQTALGGAGTLANNLNQNSPTGGGAASAGGGMNRIIPYIPRSPLKRNAPNPGWGGSFSDDSSITFDGIAVLRDRSGLILSQTAVNPRGSVEIDAGQSGQLWLTLTIEGFQDNLAIPIVGGNESFSTKAEGIWDISADDKGALKITNLSFNCPAPSSNDTDYRLQKIIPAEDDAKGLISLDVVVEGKIEGHSSTPSAGKEGKNGLSVGYERGTTSQSGVNITQEKFSIKVNVVNIPKAPEPKGSVKIKEVTAIVDGEFVIGPFVVKSASKLDTKAHFNPGTATHLKAESVEKAVYDLYSSLPEATRASMANGKLPGDEANVGMKIEIHGYASNTDSAQKNLELSLQRAKAVREVFIKKFGVPEEVFQGAHPHGEWETRDDRGMEPTDDQSLEKEAADWRKVVVKMRYTITREMGE